MAVESMFGFYAGSVKGSPALVPAQEYPSKPIRLVASFSTGAFQIVSHVAAENLTPVLGQPVVVDYRPGGGGNIGVEYAAKAAPDGYTLAVINSTHAVAPLLNKSLKYELLRDFAPITLMTTVPNLLVVHPSLPARSLKELAQLARTRPGKLTYGSGGTGSFNHLGNELFRTLAKAEIVHVPYKGGALALTGVLSGEVDFVVTTVPATIPYVSSNRLRALAVLSPERVPTLPKVPTSAEAGMPELVFVSWYGVAAPSGVKPEIITRLNGELVKIMQNPQVRAQLQKVGMDPTSNSPAGFRDYIRGEVTKWSRVIREAQIQIM
jgi:tripartite-type tricarboxylate transporter receptor subunit TctC